MHEQYILCLLRSESMCMNSVDCSYALKKEKMRRRKCETQNADTQ